MVDRIGRRELLAAAGAVGVGGVAAYSWTRLAPGRGRVAARTVTAADERLLHESDEDRTLGAFFVERDYEDPSEVLVSEHLSALQAAYDDVEYRLRIAGPSGTEWFTTNVSVFDTVDLGDHVTYQVSVAEGGNIRTLSCVAPTAGELQTRCEFEEVDVTKR
jgi:hypothetical protein